MGGGGGGGGRDWYNRGGFRIGADINISFCNSATAQAKVLSCCRILYLFSTAVFWIRICKLLGLPDSAPLVRKKNLDFYTLDDFIFEEWWKCANKQKIYFLLASWRSLKKRAGSIRQRFGSRDPDPYQNVTDPEHCSTAYRHSKSHITGTLNCTQVEIG